MRSKIQLPAELSSAALAKFAAEATRLAKSSTATGDAEFGQRFTTEELLRRPDMRSGLEASDRCAGEGFSDDTLVEPEERWHPIRAAMSWVMDVLIEGFAACGEAMGPGYFGPYGEHVADHRERSEAPIWGQLPGGDARRVETSYGSEVRDISGSELWPGSGSPQARQDRAIISNLARQSQPWRTGKLHWSAIVVAWFRPKARRDRMSNMTIQDLATLDDRTLRDIGISRHQIEHPAPYGNHYK